MIFLGMLGDCAGTDNPPLPDTGTAPPVPPPLFAGLGRAGHHSRIIFVSTICGVGAVLFFFGPRLSVWVMTRLAPPELPPPELESVYVAPYETAIGWRPNGAAAILIGPDRTPDSVLPI